ncbi:MAG: hypothetical protein ACKPKO_03830, partial [Candidatus Fonsibacter sp.]
WKCSQILVELMSFHHPILPHNMHVTSGHVDGSGGCHCFVLSVNVTEKKKKWQPPLPSTWPDVTFTFCGSIGWWKDMNSTKIWEHFQDNMQDDEDRYHYQYECAKCMAKRLNISVQEAVARIKEAAYASKLGWK